MALSEGIKRGTVEVLVLTLLQDGDMYGYQISQELASRSKGLYVLAESSLYPTLYRLLAKKVITDRQEKVGVRRTRVYYHLEKEGKKYLKALRAEYCQITQGVFNILGIADMEILKRECEDGAKRSSVLSEESKEELPLSIPELVGG